MYPLKLAQISYGDSLRWGDESMLKYSWSHDQDGHHAHVWYKAFKNLVWNQKANTLGSWYVTLWMCVLPCMMRGCAVVECLTRDQEAAGSSLTGVTALWSLSKTHLS